MWYYLCKTNIHINITVVISLLGYISNYLYSCNIIIDSIRSHLSKIYKTLGVYYHWYINQIEYMWPTCKFTKALCKSEPIKIVLV